MRPRLGAPGAAALLAGTAPVRAPCGAGPFRRCGPARDRRAEMTRMSTITLPDGRTLDVGDGSKAS